VSDDIARFAAAAEAMADAVRPLLLDVFADPVGFEVKADLSPVTVADRRAEAIIRRMIGEAWPEHGIIGEEYGAERADAPFVWVIDPIDGTKSFVTGKPLFGTLIALSFEGVPVVGIIDMPALSERLVGARGRPTTWQGRPVQARHCGSLDRAWLYATSPQMFAGDDAAAFERLRQRCYAALYGADLYAYGLVARGRVDLVCEAQLQPYDYCAVVPVIEGAGGVISDWEGRPLTITSGGRILAAGDAALHDAALAALHG
jgi:inositol-phosphate phosphatase/L-galactose 1-phosphate phosphatase/histidinol-phosphatase